MFISTSAAHFGLPLSVRTTPTAHLLAADTLRPTPTKTHIRPVVTSLFPSFLSACALSLVLVLIFFCAVTNYAHINFYKTFLPLPFYFMFLFVTTASHTHTRPPSERLFSSVPFSFSSFSAGSVSRRVCSKNEEQFTLEKFQHAFLSCPKQLLYGSHPSGSLVRFLFCFSPFPLVFFLGPSEPLNIKQNVWGI